MTDLRRTRPAPERASLEEFSRMPEEHEYRVELLRGRVVREPRPGGRHGWLTARLVVLLDRHVTEHDLGIVVTETGFLLAVDPPTVRGPDVAFIARESLPADGLPADFWTTAPELAIEVVAPSDRWAEHHDKVFGTLDAGTRVVWSVDPQNEIVSIYRSREDIRLLKGEDVLEEEELLPNFRLPLAELFTPPRIASNG